MQGLVERLEIAVDHIIGVVFVRSSCVRVLVVLVGFCQGEHADV